MARDISRRTVLKLTGGLPVAGLAEVTMSERAAAASGTGWQQFQYDSGNSGYAASASAPTSDATVDWSRTPNQTGGDEIQPSPAVVNGVVYEVAEPSGRVMALDAADGSVQWARDLGNWLSASPAVVDGRVFIPADKTLYALDATDGSTIWTAGLEARTETSPAVTNLIAHVADTEGSVYAFATDDGTLLWRSDPGGGGAASPAAVGNYAYVVQQASSGGTLYALGEGNGDPMWSRSIGTVETPTVQDGAVFVADSKRVSAFDAINGSPLWSTDLGSIIRVPPTVTSGYVFAVTEGTLFALDRSNGTIRWTFDPPSSWATSPPTVTGADYVYFGDGNGVIHCLDINGNEQWATTLDADGYVTSPPVLNGGRVYVKAIDTLHALDGDGGGGGGGGGGGSTTLELTMTDDTAKPGGVADIDITVSNNGSAKSTGIKVLINVPGDGWKIANDPEPFTSIAPHSSQTRHVEFTVPADARGAYTLEGEVTDDAGNSDTATATVTVQAVKLELEANGGSAPPGGTVTVSFELRNVGTVTAEDVTLSLGKPLNGWRRDVTETAGGTVALSSGPEESYVSAITWDTLAPDDSVSPAYELSIPGDATAGTYTVDVSASSDHASTVTGSAEIAVSKPLSVSFRDQPTRLVQTVEATRVPSPNVGQTVERPPMVAGRPTTALFALHTGDMSTFPEDGRVPVHITRRRSDGSEATSSFELGKEALDRLDPSDDAGGKLFPSLTFQRAPPEQTPPTFELPADIEAVEVVIGNVDDKKDGGTYTAIDGASVELIPGEDFELADPGTLRVGVAEIRAPQGNTGIYGNAAGRVPTDHRDPETGQRTQLATSRAKIRALVDELETYLRRVYPVADVEVNLLPAPVVGTTQGGSFAVDMADAWARLEQTFDTLDATLSIVPPGYYTYHGQGELLGVEQILANVRDFEPNGTTVRGASHPQETASVVGMTDPRRTAWVAAQEIGHNFGGWTAYPPWFAQRRWDDSEEAIDQAHARTESMTDNGRSLDTYALRSRAYDLFNGYSFLREGSADGYWGRARDSRDLNQDGQFTLTSFMSYTPQMTDEDVWADGHFYESLLSDDFAPTPPMTPDGGGESTAVLAGVARRTDSGIEIVDTNKRNGVPMPPVEDGIDISVDGPGGGTLESVTVPRKYVPFHARSAANDGSSRFAFVVPYPNTTATLTVAAEAGTTTRVPHELVLVSLVRRLPDRAFIDNPDDRRARLLDAAANIGSAIEAGDYRAADEAIAALGDDVRAWIRADYDAAANQPTREELLLELGDTSNRTATLRDQAGGGGETTNETTQATDETGGGLPDWAPLAGVGTGVLTGAGVLAYKLLGDDDDRSSTAEAPKGNRSQARDGRTEDADPPASEHDQQDEPADGDHS